MPLTHNDIIAQIHHLVARMGNRKAAAEYLKVPYDHLDELLAGQRPIGLTILRKLGIKRTVTYEWRSKTKREQNNG